MDYVKRLRSPAYGSSCIHHQGDQFDRPGRPRRTDGPAKNRHSERHRSYNQRWRPSRFTSSLQCDARRLYAACPRGLGAVARLVLEAAYEACFRAALLNRKETGSAKLYLTLLGGGAFGNPQVWIFDAIARSLRLFKNSGLDVRIVSYGSLSSSVDDMLRPHQ